MTPDAKARLVGDALIAVLVAALIGVAWRIWW